MEGIVEPKNQTRRTEQDFRPPYYAVIFTSELADDDEGYAEMSERMIELAGEQPGFLGIEMVREGSTGITVSYWADEPAIAKWKSHLEHQTAQLTGRGKWYRRYTVRVAKVERSYSYAADAV